MDSWKYIFGSWSGTGVKFFTDQRGCFKGKNSDLRSWRSLKFHQIHVVIEKANFNDETYQFTAYILLSPLEYSSNKLWTQFKFKCNTRSCSNRLKSKSKYIVSNKAKQWSFSVMPMPMPCQCPLGLLFKQFTIHAVYLSFIYVCINEKKWAFVRCGVQYCWNKFA